VQVQAQVQVQVHLCSAAVQQCRGANVQVIVQVQRFCRGSAVVGTEQEAGADVQVQRVCREGAEEVQA
jgi:hypothetical protein